MRPARICAPLVAIAASLTSGSAWAWGDEGHRIVALIARGHLAPLVRASVDQLLAKDADPLTAPDMAARPTWADKWRRIHPETAGWHYIDLELDHPDFASACRGGHSCVVDKINLFADELANRSRSDAQRIYALKMLLHLVGDLHQPLHAADSHDRGGNCEQVRYTPVNWLGWRAGWPRVASLHAYWDDEAVAQLGGDPVRVAADLDQKITPQDVKAWSRGTAADWARESFGVAQDVVYAYGGPLACVPGAPTPLSEDYENRAKSVAAHQLSEAGIRLATVLNRALSRQP